MPIIIYGVIDREFADHVLIDNRLNFYIQGIEKKLFNAKVFWSWFFYGTYVSIILVFFCFLILSDNSVNDQGLTFNFWETSTSLYCLIVIACNVQIIIFSNTFNIFSCFCLLASIGLYNITLEIYVKIWITEFSLEAISNTKIFYLSIFIIIPLACVPSFFFEMNNSTNYFFF